MSEPFYRKADTNGDGTGATIATGNYSGAAEEFYIESTDELRIHRLIICVTDSGAFDANEYGNSIELTNGINIQHRDSSDNIIADYTQSGNVKTNAGWGGYCYDVDVKTWGTGPEILLARWSFDKIGGPILLEQGHKLVFTLNDDFTGLLDHFFTLQGQDHG